jgi:hypothetical protein
MLLESKPILDIINLSLNHVFGMCIVEFIEKCFTYGWRLVLQAKYCKYGVVGQNDNFWTNKNMSQNLMDKPVSENCDDPAK